MKIDQDVLAVISDCTMEDGVLKLNSGQLDRKMYLAVNKVLEAIGGKWDRKSKGHTGITEDAFEQVMLTGEVEPPKKYGYFPTPKEIVSQMIEKANLKDNMTVLEPSAGQGAILDEIPSYCDMVAIELLDNNRKVLEGKGYEVFNEKDFMKFALDQIYDRIIMNPPFEKQQDIDHVTKAFDHLDEGGRLVAIMSNGVTFRMNKKTVAFRELVDEHGYIEELPENSFKESGTGVRTVMVVLDK